MLRKQSPARALVGALHHVCTTCTTALECNRPRAPPSTKHPSQKFTDCHENAAQHHHCPNVADRALATSTTQRQPAREEAGGIFCKQVPPGYTTDAHVRSTMPQLHQPWRILAVGDRQYPVSRSCAGCLASARLCQHWLAGVRSSWYALPTATGRGSLLGCSGTLPRALGS